MAEHQLGLDFSGLRVQKAPNPPATARAGISRAREIETNQGL